nr:BamA/TamA family outer membrane protein [Kofleriaceae bacterium]
MSIAVLAVVACSHPPVHRPGEDFVSAVRFEGNHALDDGTLGDGLALVRSAAHGGAPDQYLVDADLDRIRGNYARHGYVDADVRARVQRQGDAATVIFHIVEGPRATTEVRIDGVTDAQLAQTVRDTLPLATGTPFDYGVYDGARDRLLQVAQDAGYAHARLASHVYGDRARHVAVVVLAYDLGPRCTFGDITVSGVTGDLADAVRSRVTFSPGERYSTTALGETQRRLYGMQRFATVRVKPADTEADVIAVDVSVSEGARHETRYGGGFGMDPLTYEARLRAGYTVAGWPGPMYVTDIDLQPAYAVLRDGLDQYEPRVRARATLSRMDLLGLTDVTGIVEGDYTYMVIEGWTVYGPGARLGVQTPIGTPRVTFRAGWRFSYFDFRDASPLIDMTEAHSLGIDRPERLGAYDQSVVVDLTDNALEPHYGAYLAARVTEGGAYAAGAEQFTELQPEIRGYVPLGDATLALRARVGAIDGDVPPSERFYAGGASSNRGFGERRLAPTLSGDVMGVGLVSIPVGGAAMFDSSVELREMVGKVKGMNVGGVVFLDGGDVTETASELDLGNLHWSTGLGARLLTVIGAIRVDVGYRLNRYGIGEPDPGSRWAFHFGLGEAY